MIHEKKDGLIGMEEKRIRYLLENIISKRNNKHVHLFEEIKHFKWNKSTESKVF